jgi:hypothetical protein
MNAEKIEYLELIQAKLIAMSEFSLEVKSFVDDLLVQEGAPPVGELAIEKKTEKKTEKPAKVEKEVAKVETKPEPETAEEVEITDEMVAEVVEEYGLLEMSLEELKEELEANGITIPKKATVKLLANTVAEAILSGEISTDEDESEEASEVKEAEVVAEDEKVSTDDAEEEEGLTEEDINAMSLEELQELCEENEIEVPAATLKNVKKLRAFVIAMLDDSEEEEEKEEATVEEEQESFPASPERLAEEEKIAEEVRSLIDKKKLTIAAMKKELKKYYEGDADCKDCKGCTEEEVIECYILTKQAFVDDEGARTDAEEPYYRNDSVFCCGRACEAHPDNADVMVCTICAGEIDLAEEEE